MSGQLKLRVRLTTLRVANAFVRAHHRHHRPAVGHRFSLMVMDSARRIRGVAIVGRPVARRSDDGRTYEVTRVAIDGCPNACSALYGGARREARRRTPLCRLLTFTLASEPGTSLRAAGWNQTGTTPGRSWSVPSRQRTDQHPLGEKIRWEAP